MFSTGKDGENSASVDSRDKNVKAFLGAGSEFEGRMTFTESMRIDGKFSGQISSQNHLVIGETANLKAEVVADSVVISGAFEGDINATSKVELRSPAKVKAQIVAPVISMNEGVVFDGMMQMSSLSKGNLNGDE